MLINPQNAFHRRIMEDTDHCRKASNQYWGVLYISYRSSNIQAYSSPTCIFVFMQIAINLSDLFHFMQNCLKGPKQAYFDPCYKTPSCRNASWKMKKGQNQRNKDTDLFHIPYRITSHGESTQTNTILRYMCVNKQYPVFTHSTSQYYEHLLYHINRSIVQ